MASWCLVCNQTPEVYRSLTRLERDQFLEAYRALHK